MAAQARHESGAASAPLGAAQIAAFRRDGFVVASGLLAPGEIADLTRWTEELASALEQPGRHMVYGEQSILAPERRLIQRIENFCPFHAGFDALLARGRVIAATAQLFGESAVMFKDKINFKMPGGDGFKAHQDQQAGWSRYASLFITALVAIDAATVENGCLEIAAGQHRRGLLGPEWRPLEVADMAGFALKPLPTAPGDVVFFDSYVPHASSPNLTGAQRRVLYVTYNRASEGDHRERYFADKRAAFPPDVERQPGTRYVFRV